MASRHIPGFAFLSDVISVAAYPARTRFPSRDLSSTASTETNVWQFAKPFGDLIGLARTFTKVDDVCADITAKLLGGFLQRAKSTADSGTLEWLPGHRTGRAAFRASLNTVDQPPGTGPLRVWWN
ncbi:MAG TPA: hypothetical protein VEK39_08165 [Solirubrobacterales bacterium]|nr:hypothetical protein [Solirubrobacterales bacterium]